ncbi:cell wall protein [Myceligenerans xiligouense]|uniref:Uncharacterized protein n=1 Tax=Myceligenerans xiligouense TaxID=253184 RepID=A0A3N4YL77_9MICO|nr:cell wall protein [Myceligenerans xiligouense]RPF21453.1 hypothetical protein EDD34_2081 [Myceligenerans xiligouense]
MSAAQLRRHWRIIGAALAAVVVLTVLLLRGFDGHQDVAPSAQPSLTSPSGIGSVEAGSSDTDQSGDGPGATSDLIVFARSASSALFDWDSTMATRSAVMAAVLQIADPSGEHSPGLLADLSVWLPDEAWWARLREYQTRQRLEVTSAEVPAAWRRAVAAGQVPDLAPGTTAVTVSGVRHRDGVVADRPESWSDRVTFTVFVVCPPDGDDCWLARLGAPGKVLE